MIYPSSFRKPHRLKNFDYSSACSYMLTFVTADRKPILSTIRYNGLFEPPGVCLSEYGRITAKYIENIPKVYPNVILENYAIMPDHIHLLITIQDIRKNENDKKSVASIIRSTKK